MNSTKILLYLLLGLSYSTYSQVGIGTTTPHSSSILDLTATDKALLLTRVFSTNDITTPTNGMLIYEISNNCFKGYQNGTWTDCIYTASGGVVANCNVNGFVGSYYSGAALTASNKFTVTITNNTFSTASINFTTSDLMLSGVGGITVSSVNPTNVTLTSGMSQLVEYTLSGTSATTGTLTGTWTKLSLSCVKTATVVSPAIASLNCAGATHNGTLTAGTSASGVSSSLPYTSGDGSAYAGQTVSSTGVTGLTATLAAGNFASGSGSLTYTISGTPSTSGTASFAISIGGQTCTLTRSVTTSITIPSSITLAQNRVYLIASVYDQDYKPFTFPTTAATTAVQAADGTADTPIANFQGTITTTGVNVRIPVTATGSGTLPAYTHTITIPASLAEDGISRDLQFSWSSQTYTAATTSITATIRSLVGTFNAKKLDINAGIGNDVLGILLGTFIYPYNNMGSTTTYQVRDIAGIPDRMFGLPDNNGNSTTHLMLYLPVVAEDGKIWLNNNLGAHYTNLNHAGFNLAQQATTATDYLAYGSLFQWGRKPDGHELITYTSSTFGNAVNGTTTILNNNPTNSLFITAFISPYDWRITGNSTLWATEASANNPCPVGFRIPSLSELDTLVAAAGITNSTTAASSVLRFTVPGVRSLLSGTLNSIGSSSCYWSSNVTITIVNSPGYRIFNSSSTSNNFFGSASGYNVRCIKD